MLKLSIFIKHKSKLRFLIFNTDIKFIFAIEVFYKYRKKYKTCELIVYNILEIIYVYVLFNEILAN